MSAYKELRDRTSRELGLAGNHYDAIQKHLDAYEAAYAHVLAEKIRNSEELRDLTDDHMSDCNAAADLIDPEVS